MEDEKCKREGGPCARSTGVHAGASVYFLSAITQRNSSDDRFFLHAPAKFYPLIVLYQGG